MTGGGHAHACMPDQAFRTTHAANTWYEASIFISTEEAAQLPQSHVAVAQVQKVLAAAAE